MTPTTRLLATALDCADPRALAGFYQALTGWKLTAEEDDYVVLTPPDAQGTALEFHRVEDYRPPLWPGQERGQQLHLDFEASGGLDEAQAAAVGLGARVAPQQPGPESWRVLIDPAGHPFCLCVPAGGAA